MTKVESLKAQEHSPRGRGLMSEANEAKHYYATTVFGWATAPTMYEAIEKAVRLEAASLKHVITMHGSVYAWWCKVDLPQDAPYKIEFYKPTDVPISDGGELAITKITAKEIKFVHVDASRGYSNQRKAE